MASSYEIVSGFRARETNRIEILSHQDIMDEARQQQSGLITKDSSGIGIFSLQPAESSEFWGPVGGSSSVIAVNPQRALDEG
jgi:hypothetical protein